MFNTLILIKRMGYYYTVLSYSDLQKLKDHPDKFLSVKVLQIKWK